MTVSRQNAKHGDETAEFTETLRAAQYLRMSTDRQQYSTANQALAIAAYAASHGITIVRTYQDDGRSGLHLDRRPALKQLLCDAASGNCSFSHIIVYDVSRWGRFQDADESAFCEFICKKAGLTLHYCAEQFVNDGTLINSLLKTLKRAMAAEYSRELSLRIFAGLCRSARQGFHVGSIPRVGLRRVIVDTERLPLRMLNKGEWKSVQSDRVILVPGPPGEVELIRGIFDLFVVQGKTEYAIAKFLNENRRRRPNGALWRYDHIHQILTNEKYIGNNTYNLTSQKLRGKKIRNPSEKWIRSVGCFKPVIASQLFYQAQCCLAARKKQRQDHHTKGYMLDQLQKLHADRGTLNQVMIDECSYCPSANTYRRRFGSLTSAYRLIGYKFENWRTIGYMERGTPEYRQRLLDQLKRLLLEQGRLTCQLIDECRYCPRALTYTRHFGSLAGAYRLVGFESNRPQACGYSEHTLLSHLRTLLTRHGYISAKLINSQSRGPSTAPYRRRLGGLGEAYAKIGYKSRQHMRA